MAMMAALNGKPVEKVEVEKEVPVVARKESKETHAVPREREERP